MPKMRAIGARQAEPDTQAQQIPLRWRVPKPHAEPQVVVQAVQTATTSTMAVDPVLDVAHYYRDRAASFRKRPSLPRDDDAADERLF
jgi:hypothetical protein